MLSGETANGDYPIESVKMMDKICLEAENLIDYDAQFTYFRQEVLSKSLYMPSAESVASSAVKTAFDIGASLILVLTESGVTSELIAKYRPGVPIISLTTSNTVARQVQGLIKNTHSFVLPSGLSSEEDINQGLEIAKDFGCKRIIFTSFLLVVIIM